MAIRENDALNKFYKEGLAGTDDALLTSLERLAAAYRALANINDGRYQIVLSDIVRTFDALSGCAWHRGLDGIPSLVD